MGNLYLNIGAILFSAGPTIASTVTMSDLSAHRGGPIAQSFLAMNGDNVSIVATENGVSCVASQTLPIASSVYRDANGLLVDFADVIRSPASSIQAIAQPGAEISFRVQLKYSPDPSQPVMLEVAGQTLDLSTTLEASSDSLWVKGTAAEALGEALRRGESPTLVATSLGSGREIRDQIIAPDMVGFDACLTTLETLLSAPELPEAGFADPGTPTATLPSAAGSEAAVPPATGLSSIVPEEAVALVLMEQVPTQPVLPEPAAGLRVEFVARQDPETRIAPSTLQQCRMRNIPESVYLGRLTAVTGFFSQTQDIYVAFDEQGQVQRAYIPGIFDSDLSSEGGSARVSLAADSNLPDQPNMVKGCLGDALLEAPVCVVSDEGSDRFTIAECGVLGMSESRDPSLASFQDIPELGLDEADPLLFFTNSNRTSSIVPRDGRRTQGFRTFSTGGPGGPGGGSGEPPNLGNFPDFFPDGDDDPTGGGNDDWVGDGDTPQIAPVPLPAGIWLMLGTIAGWSGIMTLMRRRKAQAASGA